ncbi:MAG: transporter substrate-binding domain-containing protein [Selenomonadaceae bacterium]|nr:transporter substrate-binding domain-containing protein [Selenomonadaceae bacterium]
MKKSKYAFWAIGAVLAALMLVFAMGCGNGLRTDAPANDNSLQKVLDAGQFVLGFDENFPPMGFTNEKGEMVGFDIDMAQEICNRLGVKLVKHPIKWEFKETDLNDGTIDCIASMSVIPKSIEEMCLSEPYIKEELIFVVPEKSTVMWIRDLKGKRVGVQSGSTTQEALEAMDMYESLSVIALDDNMEVLQQLKEGKLDVAFVDSPTAYYFMDSSDERYFILADSLGMEKWALGFRKGDKELRNRVQEILSEMKADGTLGAISEKWFGSNITTVR